MKEKYDHYNRLIYLHDTVTGLAPKPHSDYPYNYTGLLHVADNALIFCTEDYELAAAKKCRTIAVDGINNKR